MFRDLDFSAVDPDVLVEIRDQLAGVVGTYGRLLRAVDAAVKDGPSTGRRSPPPRPPDAGRPHRLSDHGFGGLDRLAAHGAGALGNAGIQPS